MATQASAKKKVRTRRRERKNIEKGQVHISSSFNNTMVTITDTQGNALRLPQRQPWSTASSPSKCSLRVPVRAVRPLSAPFRPQVSK